MSTKCPGSVRKRSRNGSHCGESEGSGEGRRMTGEWEYARGIKGKLSDEDDGGIDGGGERLSLTGKDGVGEMIDDVESACAGGECDSGMFC